MKKLKVITGVKELWGVVLLRLWGTDKAARSLCATTPIEMCLFKQSRLYEQTQIEDRLLLTLLLSNLLPDHKIASSVHFDYPWQILYDASMVNEMLMA